MIRLSETREKLIAVDLDDTFTDHTGAFREVLAQLGVSIPSGMPETANYVEEDWFDNEPLEEGEKPRFTPVALRLVEHANSPLALLRAIQHTDCEGKQILKEHWIRPPEHEPSDEQVERAAEAGYFLSARSYFSYGNLKPWDKVKQASKEKWREWARLMLEAALNEKKDG